MPLGQAIQAAFTARRVRLLDTTRRDRLTTSFVVQYAFADYGEIVAEAPSSAQTYDEIEDALYDDAVRLIDIELARRAGRPLDRKMSYACTCSGIVLPGVSNPCPGCIANA